MGMSTLSHARMAPPALVAGDWRRLRRNAGRGARRVAADVGPAAGLDVVGRPVGPDSGSQAGGTGRRGSQASKARRLSPLNPPPQTPPQAPGPTFRTGINFVRVDVIVSDRKGQPLVDLKQADFEVFEDGKSQTIETFKLVQVDGQPAPGDRSAAADSHRLRRGDRSAS